MSETHAPGGEALSDFALDTSPQTFRGAVTDTLARWRSGDLGSLPAVLAILVLVLVFSLASETFLTALNFANFLDQAADFSATTLNPAGLALYRRSDFMVTPRIRFTNSNAEYIQPGGKGNLFTSPISGNNKSNDIASWLAESGYQHGMAQYAAYLAVAVVK